MARRTAATFGYAAFILELSLGWFAGWDIESLLVRGLAAMLIASLVGWTIGALAYELTLKSDPSTSSASR